MILRRCMWGSIACLAVACSHPAPDAHAAAARLLESLDAVDQHCETCMSCNGPECEQCLLEINQGNARAMEAALPAFGRGHTIAEITSFDQLALPADVLTKVHVLAAREATCYETIRRRRHTGSAAQEQPPR